MPNRIIREAILTSEPVCSLGWSEEVFYRRLMSIVDDFGRHEANPQLLRSKCYPLQTDAVRVADITRWMAACQKAGVIVLYEVLGKQYIEITKFRQQTRTPSKFPPPPAIDINCNQAPADAHLGVSVFGVVSEGEGVSRKREARSKKVPLPDGFAVSAEVKAWAQLEGFDRLDEHLQAFANKCAANSYVYADWDAAFKEAIREDWAKLRGRTTNGAAPPPEAGAPGAMAAEKTRREMAEFAARPVSKPPEALKSLVQKLKVTA